MLAAAAGGIVIRVRGRVGIIAAVSFIPIVDWWGLGLDGSSSVVGIRWVVDWEVVGDVTTRSTLIDLSVSGLIELIAVVPVSADSMWL